jgi:antibiotic biosynthesis monooxygenase (ABM) superfamily enzyme
MVVVEVTVPRAPAIKPVIEPVTVVVSRRVLPGREADYERWIHGVTGVVQTFEGYLGMNIFRPARPGEPWVFVYKFDSGEHLDAWTKSEVRARWVTEALTITADSQAEEASGLESWFTLPGAAAMVPPPKWKMALVSTVVVWVLANLVGPVVHRLPLGTSVPAGLLTSLLSTAIVASLLTWVVMPRVTRWLARWLYVQAPKDTPRAPSA